MIEIFKEMDNTYRFQLKSANGQGIFSSVPFANEEEIARVIAELRPLVHKTAVFERKTDYEGKFLFNLKSSSGDTIGNSRLFDSEAGMENGIKNLKKQITALP